MTQLDTKHPSYKATLMVYILMGGSLLLPAALVAALLGLIGTRKDTQGGRWESHATWQMVSIIGGGLFWAVGGALFYTQGLTPALWVALVGGPWFLYRLIHGGLRFYGEMPVIKPGRIL